MQHRNLNQGFESIDPGDQQAANESALSADKENKLGAKKDVNFFVKETNMFSDAMVGDVSQNS